MENRIRTDERGAGANEVPRSGAASGTPAPDAARRAGRIKLVVLFVLFSLPVLASYLAYYVFPSERRSNYGTLIEPQRDLPDVPASGLDGQAVRLSALRGRWVMLTVDSGTCDAACANKLWWMRQVRLTTGKDRDRVERVWLVTDAQPVRPQLPAEYDGMVIARVDPARLASALPVDAQAGTTMADHVWIVDPLGHVMMRFHRQADPSKVKKDIAKLLKASRIG